MAEIIIEDMTTKDLRLKMLIKFSLELNLNLMSSRKSQLEILLPTSLTLTQSTAVFQRTKDISSNTPMDPDSYSENQEQDPQVLPLEFTSRNTAKISTKMLTRPLKKFQTELCLFVCYPS